MWTMRGVPIRERWILFACRCMRSLERLLPVGALWIVCWPMAAIRAACRLMVGAPTIRQFDRVPTSLRARPDRFGWVAHLWREQTRMSLAQLMYLWPDRLSGGRWKNRCRCVGLERVERDHALGRPIILATLHFGPSVLLVHWLRAQGMPAAGLRDSRVKARPVYWRYIDRKSAVPGRSDGPSVFDRTELRSAHDHLLAGRILLMTAEGRYHRHIRVHREGLAFDVASGPLRLAAATGAIVIPCLIAAGPRMSFTIHLGEPVPADLVIDADLHRAGCDHFLGELLPVVRRHHHPQPPRPDRPAHGQLPRARPGVSPRRRNGRGTADGHQRRDVEFAGILGQERLARLRTTDAELILPALLALIRSESSDTLGPPRFPGSWATPERPALCWSLKLVMPAR
jgi:lauroyl/myristoyl acyltransferase